jgi:hypothetical protein
MRWFWSNKTHSSFAFDAIFFNFQFFHAIAFRSQVTIAISCGWNSSPINLGEATNLFFFCLRSWVSILSRNYSQTSSDHCDFLQLKLFICRSHLKLQLSSSSTLQTNLFDLPFFHIIAFKPWVTIATRPLKIILLVQFLQLVIKHKICSFLVIFRGSLHPFSWFQRVFLWIFSFWCRQR